MQIEITFALDEKDVADLAAEHEGNESSFVHEFSRRILEAASKATRKMRDVSRAIDMVNPFSNIDSEHEKKEPQK